MKQQFDKLQIALDTTRNLRTVTNAEFISNVFRNIPEGAFAAVCSKPGNPEIGGWKAEPAINPTKDIPAGNNNYINCSSFYPGEDGSFNARSDRFAAYHFLMLDDLGTKIPFEQLNGFELSWLIETSPGNFQGGIILDKPITDSLEAERLIKALISAGLCDPGSSGINRWARLPVAINGKPKYANKQFNCLLTEWRPEKRYSPEEIIKFFGLKLPSPDQKASPHIQTQTIPNGTTEVRVRHSSSGNESRNLLKIQAMLKHIDTDCSYSDWLNVQMAVFHESNGSEEGFQVVDCWSSKGKKYKGSSELREKWKSFKSEVNNPITIATIYSMVKNRRKDWRVICDAVSSPFVDDGKNGVIDPMHESTTHVDNVSNPLKKFSLLGKSEEIEKNVISEIPILGQIALHGQLTVLYSAPNTGKTLITFSLLINALSQGKIESSKVYYLNVDDNSAGLLEKLRIAEEYKFNVLAEGYEDFNANQFLKYVIEMTASDQASGVIIILDTLKKFVNLMDKTQSSNFSKIIRKFALKGGTLIALAHTNKNPGRDGKPVYGGTSDIIDDFDCAYTIAPVKSQADSDIKVVEFENIKRRGNVIQSVAYSYCNKSDISYSQLLASVQLIDDTQLLPLKQASDIQSDREKIGAVVACINEGINTKMKLAAAVSSRTGISRASAIQLIEKYTGVDPTIHKWFFSVHERGAKVFTVLETTPQDQDGGISEVGY